MRSQGLWIPLLALLGLSVSAYVWRSQKTGARIACWTRDCDRVIRSHYSRLLGVHNSAVGFWLYAGILVMDTLRQLAVQPWSDLAAPIIGLFSLIGTLISAYLTYVQFFVLRGICNWCLTSSALILAIFLITLS